MRVVSSLSLTSKKRCWSSNAIYVENPVFLRYGRSNPISAILNSGGNCTIFFWQKLWSFSQNVDNEWFVRCYPSFEIVGRNWNVYYPPINPQDEIQCAVASKVVWWSQIVISCEKHLGKSPPILVTSQDNIIKHCSVQTRTKTVLVKNVYG